MFFRTAEKNASSLDLKNKSVKIVSMLKELSCIFLIMSLAILPSAAQTGNGVHAGTPAGFYDDIELSDYDENEADENNSDSQTGIDEDDYSTDDDMMPPERTKATKDYASIYNELEVPSFSYLHNIDPDQYYDMKDAAWSVYPLLRLNSPIYFKSITIEPGYYLLTPREHDGDWFLLFKQNGLVKHIIPIYDKDYTPEMFYDQNIAKPKYTGSQKAHMGFLSSIGKVKSTKRQDAVQTYMEINDLENYFLSIIIYYGPHKYSTIFRTIKL